MSADIQPSLSGFPLSDHAGENASKADLFFIASALFRICASQNIALKALVSSDAKALQGEISATDHILDELYSMLQTDDDE